MERNEDGELQCYRCGLYGPLVEPVLDENDEVWVALHEGPDDCIDALKKLIGGG